VVGWQVRASIIIDCNWAKCCGGEERREKRREVGCKLTGGLNIRTEKLRERDK
jgi:hypothetical protein